MKKLVTSMLFGCALMGVEKASAQITLDNANHCTNGGYSVTSVSCTLSSVSAGDLITVEYADDHGLATSVSDSVNGQYTNVYYVTDSADPNSSGISYHANSASGSVTVTVALSGSDPWAFLSVQAWKGAATSSVLDTSAITQQLTSTSGTAANATCGTAQSPSRAGELVIGYLVPDWDSSVTAGTSYTLIDTTTAYGNPGFPEYWIQTGLSATNAPFTNAADDWTSGCAAFKPMTTPGSGKIITVAGSGYWGYTGDGGAATSARFAYLNGIAVNAAGDMIISDGGNSVLRKVAAATGIITTIAGTGTGGYAGDGGPATSAELLSPMGVAVDSSGNIFFTDNGGTVREIAASTGVITTVAGTGNWGYWGDGGPATAAGLSYDTNVAIDSAGNLYIADRYNMRVRKVSAATGIITTIAGNGTAGYTGNGGPATSAELNWPFGVAVDALGNVYIADLSNNVIRKVNASTGNISTVAGNGTAGYSGDGGAATSAKLNGPYDVAVDAAGNLYISDSGNNVIRMVAAGTGTITTVAGNGTQGFSGDGGSATSAELNVPWDITTDPSGNIYIADSGNLRARMVGSSITEPTTTTPTITWTAPASIPYGTALGALQLNATASTAGTFTYTPALGTTLSAGVHSLSVLFTPTDTTHYSPVMATVPITVTQVTPSITWQTPAAVVYGIALSATQLNATASVPGTFVYTPALGAVPPPGLQTLSATFTPTDTVNYATVVATVTLTISAIPGPGIITTVAGNGFNGYTGDGGPAINAELANPGGVAVDAAGNLYIASYGSSVVRRVDAVTGLITTIAGTGTAGYSGDGGPAISAKLNGPCGIALDSAGNIYIADTENYRIRKVNASTGIITTVAGNGTFGYTGNGSAATSAEISLVQGLVLDSAGNLYFADEDDMVVRKVAASTGIISAVAGTGTAGYSGDGSAATSAKLRQPIGVSLDSAGNIYIVDGGNNVVRKVTASTGVITTIVGTGTAGYSGDGGAASSAKLNPPYGAITVDSANNLYIVDSNNNRIRFVSATTGIITTIAGNGTDGYSGDGGPATSAELAAPQGIALDSHGNFYIADIYNNRVREVGGTSASSVAVSISPTTKTLYAIQQQQFTATVTNTSNTAVNWSISPAGLGTVSSSGLYTAPSAINTQQTVTVTATSQADTTKSASATVTLMPTISVSVSPASVSLYGGQQQQFSSTVTNTSNTSVTWSISPTGVGTISTSGDYTAPSSVTTQTVITVKATSQADSSKSASATVYLLPPCVSNGYSYVRSIVIDHAKVPNSDQINFPFLFSVTDPALKSAANGGHVTSATGTDIIFSIDASGQTKLDYEVERYDPTTGQFIAWVRIPTLSHIADTNVYLFYGNSNVTTSQQNPTGVWDSNFAGVWHLPNGSTLSANDSTSNADNGAITGATAGPGVINGAASFDGNSSRISHTNATALQFSGNFTIAFWLNAARWGGVTQGVVGQKQNEGDGGWQIYNDAQLNTTKMGIRVGNSGDLFSNTPVTVGNWQYWTFVENNGVGSWYVNGVQDVSAKFLNSAASVEAQFYMGYAQTWGDYYKGLLDEVQLSNAARSPDWVGTEYNNQSSPSTFYSLNTESTVAVAPGGTSLYASQSQQFSAAVLEGASCTSTVIWSMPPNSPGTLSGDGLYTAPASITAQQSIVITATDAADSTRSGTALATLLPEPQSLTLTLAALTPPPYVKGTTQQFSAKLVNQGGTPLNAAAVTFTVTGANPTSSVATTDATGIATFSYAGANNGDDTIQATAPVGGTQVTSNTLAVSWVTPVQPISTSTITGEFFLSDDSGGFDTPINAVPVFSQTFPTINFNPPSGTIPGNTSSVDVETRPWTDVTTDLNGNFTGTIVAQGNGYQAGVGPMYEFQVAFFGAFTVASAGDVTFNFYNDDGFVFGVGNGATRVSGSIVDMPVYSAFGQYPAVGAYNEVTSPVGNTVVVHFPAAGTYPYEVDYSECCGGQEVLTMTQGATSPTGVAPTGSLTLSPGSVQPLAQGGQQSFTVLADDAAGNPIPNAHIGLVITGADNLQLSATTNSSGIASFVYQDVNAGTAYAQAIAYVNGMMSYSNQVAVPWTLSAASATGSGSSGSLSVSISAPNTLILPQTLALTGSASDPALPSGDSISYAWSKVSGPGTVTFVNALQASTTASFSEAGSYQLQLAATDVNGSASAQVTVAVNPQPGINQGWIGSPAYGASVSCFVPITVASGETLTSGELTVYPANNPSAVTVLSTNTTGSGQIGNWDTTQVSNGSYWITLQATDSNGNSQYNLTLVSVTGNCKAGRVTSTVTDLVVPANGLPIQIQRTYDTLNANTIGDFGYGWNLGTKVDLSVGPKGDVTFTLGGIRRTFYLSPLFGGWAFPFYFASYTPEPGLHGTLAAGGGCTAFPGWVIPDGSLWDCIDGSGYFSPTAYTYTDPTGTSYVMTAAGNLQQIIDKNGNTLNIAASGITSSTGLSVPFTRDTSGRITNITDPQGHEYQYGYDSNGNLVSVTYPSTPTSTTYNYYTGTHYYESGSDFDGNALSDFHGNALPTASYFGPSDTDANGLPLNNRLKSVTDALSETTSYAYNLSTNTTTITYPPDASSNQGTATMVYSAAGDLLSSTDPLGHTTTNTYDANRNLISVTDPMGKVTSYSYDANGNKTSTTYPATATSTNTTSTTTYNQYSEPTQTTDELGNVRTFSYDVNFNPQGVTDNVGTLATFTFNTSGTMQTGAVGYDITMQPSMASQFTYDTDGNMTGRTDALGRTTSYTYDSLGHKLTMTQPLPNSSTSAAQATTTYTYDDFGNLTQTSAPLGRVTQSAYDGNGNKQYDIDANGKKTQYGYDALNRLNLTTYPDSTTSSKTYDFRGNVVTETDQAGHVTKHHYDLAGRQTSVTQAYGTSNATTTTYAYDNAGRKTPKLTH